MCAVKSTPAGIHRSLAEMNVGQRGRSLLPGGYGRSSLAVGPWSPSAVCGAGYRIWDDDGRELIDLNNNFTSLIHGHAHPVITEAASTAMREGASFGLPNARELEHARMLMTYFPDLDQVRYTNSGTEAVMLAIRVARAYTARDVAVFVQDAYHGHSDVALLSAGSRRGRGVPRGTAADVVTTPINDIESLRAQLGSRKGQVAVVVLDFMPNQAGLIRMTQQFAQAAQEFCRQQGILLVADEVINFRFGQGGLAAHLGVQPDAVVTGKVIGGGLPVGAVIGGADLMAVLDPLASDGLEHGGTFSGNPVTMAAGRAALELLTQDVLERINTLGDEARSALTKRVAGLGWEARGFGSLFRLFPVDTTITESAQSQHRLWWAAYERGVLVTHNALASISTPMDAAVVADAVDRLSDAVESIVKGHAVS